ncbi:MAG: nickel-responsive transcriptional regulator NikR [archaeon]
MEQIVRKGIAFDPQQLGEFDQLIRKKGYRNRSEAVRDIIRKELIEDRSDDPDKRMMATLTIVYNHHQNNVQHELTHVQHHHAGLIRSSLHVHMDEQFCLEILVMEGSVRDIRKLSEAIISAKGVIHGKLVLTGIS